MRLLSSAVGTTCELVVMYHTGFLLLVVDMNEMSVTLIESDFQYSSFVAMFVCIRQSLCPCRVIVCTAIRLAAYQG